MDGITAMKELRKLDIALPPIIALTANAMEKDKYQYVKDGMDDYLPKPVTINSLQKVLVKWLPVQSKMQQKGS
ncbi:MAG: response regulator [Flavobacteriales bacterium]|nr:response regulator [Flavobacteriales bacterium]